MLKFLILILIIGSYIGSLSGCSQPVSPNQTPVVTTIQPDKVNPPPPVTSTAVSPIPPNSVVIQNYKFIPQKIIVAKGTKVTWINNDSSPHSVNSRDGLFDSTALQQGQTFSYTFDKTGTFDYVDKVNLQLNPTPSPLGTVVVE